MPFAHTSQPRLHAPSVGGLPVVFDEPDVVDERVQTEGAETADVQVQNVQGRRFDDDLELVVVLKAKGVIAVAAVGGPSRRLNVGGTPRLRPDRAQEGRGVEGPAPSPCPPACRITQP